MLVESGENDIGIEYHYLLAIYKQNIMGSIGMLALGSREVNDR